MALAIFAVAAVGAQQAFAGVAPIAEVLEVLTDSGDSAIIDYEIHNHSDFSFYNDMGLGPWFLWGFAVEVDPEIGGDPFDATHDGPGRADWCAGDLDCTGFGGTALVTSLDWDSGIQLTNRFGGLNTIQIGAFDTLFLNHDQVALFFAPNLVNMIPAGGTSVGEFSVSGDVLEASDMVFLCLTPINDIVNCETGEILSSDVVLVGGQMINVDSSALILAGGQMTAAWILPVLVAGAGFAIVIARKI